MANPCGQLDDARGNLGEPRLNRGIPARERIFHTITPCITYNLILKLEILNSSRQVEESE